MIYHKNHKGYTLVEVMIAIVISLVLILAATATYIAQNRSYVTQENVAEINTQSKIAHDMIANSIRSAGFGIPADLNADPINAFMNIITPVDGGAANADMITIVGGFRRVATLNDAGGGCPAGVVPLGSRTVRITYTGDPAIDNNTRRLLSIDGVQFVQVSPPPAAGCTLADGFCSDAADILLDRPLVQDYPCGRPVYLVEDITYCVDVNLNLRRIRRNGFPAVCAGGIGADDDIIAQNIQDLQFAYAIDADGDGLIDIGNGNPNLLDDPDFWDGNDARIVLDPSIIGAVRINVLAMANNPDPDFAGLGSPPPNIENRLFAAVNDNLRRRWWQTLVTMRNW